MNRKNMQNYQMLTRTVEFATHHRGLVSQKFRSGRDSRHHEIRRQRIVGKRERQSLGRECNANQWKCTNSGA